MKPENLRVVTVVYGDEYKKIAELTLPRAERVLGSSVEVFTGDDWADVKLRDMWESIAGPTLCIDADMVFRSWDWAPWDPTMFNAVYDRPYMSWRGQMRYVEPHMDARRLINGGLWMALPEHRPVFEMAHFLKGLPRYYDHRLDPMGDQFYLNHAIQKMGVVINPIPDTMNFQMLDLKAQIPEDVHVIHAVSVGQKLQRIQELCATLD